MMLLSGFVFMQIQTHGLCLKPSQLSARATSRGFDNVHSDLCVYYANMNTNKTAGYIEAA